MENVQRQRRRQARNQSRLQRQRTPTIPQPSDTTIQMDSPPTNAFTMIVELNHVTHQLIYPHPPMSQMQLSPISAPDYPSLYYPTQGYYQTHWFWVNFNDR